MRYMMLLLGCLFGLLLLGCSEEGEPAPQATTSLLTFRYDAARDVVLATTHALATTDDSVTAQQYATALALRPEVSYAPSTTLRLASPEVTVDNGALTVNYREAAGLQGLASAQVSAVLAALEAWFWVPGITEVRVQANGQPLTALGPVVLEQPMPRRFHTFVYQPATTEVAYLVGSLMPATLAEAVELLQQRQIREFPATQGFRPLLPQESMVTVRADALADGVLPIDLAADFPRVEPSRLAGMVLMFTQFPQVEAVRFTFGGQTVNIPFMRSNLGGPITPYDLLLPAEVGTVAGGQTLQELQSAARAALGQPPASFGPALTWRTWAVITAVPTAGAAPQTLVLQRGPVGYNVVMSGTNLPLAQLLERGVPREAIQALRLPGWEQVALAP